MQHEHIHGPSPASDPDAAMRTPRWLQQIVRWPNKRLHRKFFLILATALSATSLLFLVLVVTLYRNQLVEEHTRASMQVNRLLEASLKNAMLKRDLDGLREIVRQLGDQEEIVAAMILNRKFDIRFSSLSDRIDSKLETSEIREALATRTPQASFLSATDGSELLRSINPVSNQKICSECHGLPEVNPVNGLLIVDYDATDIRQNALRTALLLGAIGALVILAAGLIIWAALHKLVTVRVRSLQKTSRKLAAGDLMSRAALDGADEISEFGASFNAMAEWLGKTLADLNNAGEFLQSVIDAIPDGVRVIDDKFNIVKTNDAYCRQLGQHKQEVVGTKCYESSHQRDEPCEITMVRCPVVELRNSAESTLKISQRHLSSDGRELFVEVSAARIDLTIHGKRIPCIVESIRDLAAQAKISHEQRLSEIGLLATGVAHEIHNPLSSIQLALKALQSDLESGGSSADANDYFEIAETEIGKCLKVTDGLMMLSEPPSASPQLVRIDHVIPQVISLLSYQAQQAKIEVQLELTEGLRILAADSDARMIVVNLAQNAFHAMPDGGVLTIRGRKKYGKIIELQFEDTGVGILPSNLDKIFLPYWTKRGDYSEGRGLGLSICRAIVGRMGGNISIESDVGKGTRFFIEIPDAEVDI
ncbi:MAG: PAS domain S-box protein [Gammaproteobacteria bacterium]|nr:PAS domain S-box protein [Gammaproteobacteria bacterium]